MPGNRPLIGILAAFDYEKNFSYLKEGYFQGIYKSGGLAVTVPPTEDAGILEEIFEKCDGILLTGGPDLDAKHYEENNMPFNGQISPARDFMELYVARMAIARNKPVLGICRGIQVMNVALGGTLYQDIHVQIRDNEVMQHDQKAPQWYPTHNITLKKDSWVRKLYGEEQLGVNSFHHQAVKGTAPGFDITATADDGVIESIEFKDHPFAVGVQWHPELMWQKDEQFLSLFKALVEQAGK